MFMYETFLSQPVSEMYDELLIFDQLSGFPTATHLAFIIPKTFSSHKYLVLTQKRLG